MLGARDCGPLSADVQHGFVCGSLLDVWASLAGDPDMKAARWPRNGVTASILKRPRQVVVFPDEKEGPIDPHDAVFGDLATKGS